MHDTTRPPQRLPDGRWFVSAAADADRLLRDPRCVPRPNPFLAERGVDWMLHHHGEMHAAQRRAFRAPFSPRAVGGRSEAVARTIDGVIDDLVPGDLDLLGAFAFPVPLLVIADLLGISGLDAASVHARWDDLMASYGPMDDRGARAADRAICWLSGLIRTAMEAPAPGSLTHDLLRAGRGAGITDAVIASDLLLVLGAGFDTTMALIANTLVELLARTDAVAIARDQEHLARFVEEVLRLQPSVQWVGRRLADTVTVGRTTLPAGADVVISLGAANRDPARYPDDPDRLDPATGRPPHLAFGAGPHLCLGAHLGRLEAVVAVGTLLRRFPATRLTGPIMWRDHSLLRCPIAVPATLAS